MAERNVLECDRCGDEMKPSSRNKGKSEGVVNGEGIFEFFTRSGGKQFLHLQVRATSTSQDNPQGLPQGHKVKRELCIECIKEIAEDLGTNSVSTVTKSIRDREAKTREASLKAGEEARDGA